jgi:hypothetical protein
MLASTVLENYVIHSKPPVRGMLAILNQLILTSAHVTISIRLSIWHLTVVQN